MHGVKALKKALACRQIAIRFTSGSGTLLDVIKNLTDESLRFPILFFLFMSYCGLCMKIKV